MKITADNFFTTSDGAHIYFEDRGKGTPIIMVPGFLCTTKFFEKNAEDLSQKFRVITMDPRGQGYSSKMCGGNTLKRNATDIKELIDHLKLDHAVLLGWSLASSVAVTYAVDFGQYHLDGLALVDGSLYPFSGEIWNHHRGKNYNVENWLNTYLPLYSDPETFYEKFVQRISCRGGMSENMKEWVKREFRKTMPWSALELHYDFCHTDNVSQLKKVTVPVAIFGAESEAYGLEMTETFAGKVKGYCEVHKFYESGHLMFLYEADKFNRRLADFTVKANELKKKKKNEGRII